MLQHDPTGVLDHHGRELESLDMERTRSTVSSPFRVLDGDILPDDATVEVLTVGADISFAFDEKKKHFSSKAIAQAFNRQFTAYSAPLPHEWTLRRLPSYLVDPT